LRLDYLAGDDFSADFRFYHSNTQGGSLNYNWQAFDYQADAFTFHPADANDTNLTYEQNNLGDNDRDIFEIAIKLDWSGDWGGLTSVTAFNQLEEWYGSDQAPYSESLTQYPFGPLGGPFDGIAQQYWDLEAISQELRLAWPEDRSFRWLVGAYFVSTDRFVSTPVVDDTGVGIIRIERQPTGAGQPTTFSFLADDNDNTAYALFGQLNYDISEQLEAAFALRYDEDERIQKVSPFDTSGAAGTRRSEVFDKLQPKISLRWRINDDTSLFSSWSQGFRSGQFNQQGTANAAEAAGIAGVFDIVGQEETSAFEVGLKGRLMNGLAEFGISAFRTKVEGQQYFLFFAPTSAQVLAGIDAVRLVGGEAELTLSLTDGLDLYAAYGLTNSEIEEYSVMPSFAGNKAPYVPEDTLNAGAQYRVALGAGVGLLARLDYERRGEQYWDPDNSTARDPVSLISMRVGVEGERWSAIAWARNLGDEQYLAEFVLGGFVQLAPPRAYGVDFNYAF